MPTLAQNNFKLGSQLDVFLNSANVYITQGVAPSTMKAYRSAWTWFTTFCFSLQIFPILILTVCAFIVYGFESHQLKIATIRKMLAGLQFHAQLFNLNFPSVFTSPSIYLLLKGIDKSTLKVPDKHLPITLSILHRLVFSLRKGQFSAYINTLLEAVFLTAFYGFMHIGEFASDSKCFNPDLGLSFSDLRFSPVYFSLFIKRSKSDSTGSGITITISKITNRFCPYTSIDCSANSRTTIKVRFLR